MQVRYNILWALLFVPFVASATCDATLPRSKPDHVYIDHQDGTVTDAETDLMWMKCPLGYSYDGSSCSDGPAVYNWSQALQQAQSANAGAGSYGYTDWRVPNVKELLTLAERACENPAINSTVFPATVAELFWSASPNVNSLAYSQAWVVNFTLAQPSHRHKQYAHLVRLVRDAR